jgi:hypothetical protein
LVAGHEVLSNSGMLAVYLEFVSGGSLKQHTCFGANGASGGEPTCHSQTEGALLGSSSHSDRRSRGSEAGSGSELESERDDALLGELRERPREARDGPVERMEEEEEEEEEEEAAGARGVAAVEEACGAELQRGRLGTPTLLHILADVAAALAHLHRNGVIHRDVKVRPEPQPPAAVAD